MGRWGSFGILALGLVPSVLLNVVGERLSFTTFLTSTLAERAFSGLYDPVVATLGTSGAISN